MSLGSWDPNTEQAKHDLQVDQDLLKRFIAISLNDQLDQLDTQLSGTEQQAQASLMQLNKKNWGSIAKPFSDNDIEHLMRFFTVAEKLPGWEAGANSPVIWLGKVLKKRGTGINRELVLWIKANSDNQFLPHGPLL
ncbi:MAG: hypothetical protein V3T17_14225 [Pseudomonadales bacterium]